MFVSFLSFFLDDTMLVHHQTTRIQQTSNFIMKVKNQRNIIKKIFIEKINKSNHKIKR